MKIPAILFTVVLTISHCRAFAVDNNSVQPRIVGGKQAENDKLFPWQASIVVKKNDSKTITCSGAIINVNWILTSAECILGAVEANITTGTINLKDVKEGGNLITKAAKCIPHEQYDKKTFANDIGLIQLAKSLTFDDKVKSIPLSYAALGNDAKVTVSGFGESEPGKGKSDNLRYAHLKTIANVDCNKEAKVDGFSKTVVCANSIDTPLSGICNGDSGAPLNAEIDKEIKLVGVGIAHIGNCDPSKPSVFTRIESYQKWIEEKVQPGKQNSGLAFYSTPVLVLSAVVAKLFM